MKIGILTNISEQGLALLPENVKNITEIGVQVVLESNKAASVFLSDNDYKKAGASFSSRNEILSASDLLLTMHPLHNTDLDKITENTTLLGVFNPIWNKAFAEKAKTRGISLFSMDFVPHTPRAQAMDILLPMATVAKYKSMLEATLHLPTFFPMFITASGTISPAKVLIIGTGIARLQAIATARKLGAQVAVFDVQTTARKEVLSLGAKIIEVAGGYTVEQTEQYKLRQAELVDKHAAASNVVICTAQIPGCKAAVILKKYTVGKMKAGSIIIDLAAATGGNCELTQGNKTINYHGVSIVGTSYYPSQISLDTSRRFGKNMVHFLKLIIKNNQLNLNFDDDIVKDTCIAHQGSWISERFMEL